MPQTARKTLKMKIFPKGQVVIPADIRRRYNIEIGDQIEFITSQDGILLKPSKHRKTGRTLTDELFGLLRSYSPEGDLPDKKMVEKATEVGFSSRWFK